MHNLIYKGRKGVLGRHSKCHLFYTNINLGSNILPQKMREFDNSKLAKNQQIQQNALKYYQNYKKKKIPFKYTNSSHKILLNNCQKSKNFFLQVNVSF